MAPTSRASPRAAEGLALLVWTAGIGVALSLDDPRLRYPTFLAALALATGAWLWLSTRPEGTFDLTRAALALAVGARLFALTLAPAFSDDVFRYIFEGRVVWVEGPAFPFLHPPADAPRLGIPAELLDASWLRINHPDIPTIYPPVAQLVFVLATGLGELLGRHHLAVLKVALVAAELGAAWALARALEAEGRPRSLALLVLLSPLSVLEVAREGHVDALSMLGLSLGILGFTTARGGLGYGGFALAALGKLNGAVAMIAAVRATRRGLAVGLALLSLLLLPLAFAGLGSTEALGTYAASWRAGDGAFTLALSAAEALIGGDWRRIGAVTITRHQIARALVFGAFAAFAAFVLRRPGTARDVPRRAGLLLLALLLLTPALHPWYALWVLPFVLEPGPARRASMALVALAPLLHHPAWLELETGVWTDLGWARALVHLPVWALLVRDLAGARTARSSGIR